MSSVQDLLIPAAVVGLVLMVASGGGGGAPAKEDGWGGMGELGEEEIFEPGDYGGGYDGGYPSRAVSEMTAPVYSGAMYPLSSVGNMSELRFDRNLEQAKESKTVTDHMCLSAGNELEAIKSALVDSSRQWQKAKAALNEQNLRSLSKGLNEFAGAYCDENGGIMSNYVHEISRRYDLLMEHASDGFYAIGNEDQHGKVARGRTAHNIQTLRGEIAKVQELYLEVFHGAKDTVQEFRLHRTDRQPLDMDYQEEPQENPIDIGTTPNFTSMTSMAADLVNHDIPADYDTHNDSIYSVERPRATLSTLDRHVSFQTPHPQNPETPEVHTTPDRPIRTRNRGSPLLRQTLAFTPEREEIREQFQSRSSAPPKDAPVFRRRKATILSGMDESDFLSFDQVVRQIRWKADANLQNHRVLNTLKTQLEALAPKGYDQDSWYEAISTESDLVATDKRTVEFKLLEQDRYFVKYVEVMRLLTDQLQSRVE